MTFNCVKNNENKSEIEVEENIVVKKEKFLNSFKIDTSLNKTRAFGDLKLSNSIKKDSIISLCNCKKDKKNNILKIQIKSAIPTQKELDTMNENSKKWNRLLYHTGFNFNNTPFKGQLKYLTFTLKDSIVKSINIYSKSTDNEYNGIDFDSLSVNRYKINISKFDYSIASNVYGTYELRLNKNFGLFKNDTIIKGNFVCNNWRIKEKESIKSLKF